MGNVEKKIYRFGVFEADARSGELRKAGMRIRLQEQPFQVLSLLIERRGEVVTREEIRQKLWPSDTFVDFDHSLNTIVNKIREALGDSAANPHFIETLAKRGYRFLVPIASDALVDTTAQTTNRARSALSQEQELYSTSGSGSTSIDELPNLSPIFFRALFLLIQTMYLIFYLVALGRLWAIEDLLDVSFGSHKAITITLIVSAGIGIPIRLFLLSAASFGIKSLGIKFHKLFPCILVLDESWALAPFLLTPQIGIGLALAAAAALIYVPFAQRALIMMHERTNKIPER